MWALSSFRHWSAMVGFGYILVGRAHFSREIWMAVAVVFAGCCGV